MPVTKKTFIEWLLRRGYTAVAGEPDTYAHGDTKYAVRMYGAVLLLRGLGGVWREEMSFRYSDRKFTPEDRLDWKTERS